MKRKFDSSEIEIKEEPAAESLIKIEPTRNGVKEEIESNFLLLTHEIPKAKKIKFEEMDKKEARERNLLYHRNYSKTYVRKNNFACTQCERAFSRKRELEKHLERHENLECEKCKRKFEIKKFFLQHKCLICEICGKIFYDSFKLQRHIDAIHKKSSKFECDHCGVETTSKDTLIRHLKGIHIKQEKSFQCDHCEKIFAIKFKLKDHLKYHIKEQCKICDKLIVSSIMKAHLREVHGGTKNRFECEKCQKSYTRKGQLKIHLQSHEGKFRCNVCDKIFSTPLALKRHLGFHQNEANKCKICGKSYSARHVLAEHILTIHHDKSQPKKFQCVKCKFSSNLRRVLTKHERIHDKK